MKKTSPKAKIALIVVGLVVYAGAGYFLLVGKQSAKAAEVKEQIAEVEAQITTARIASRRAAAAPEVEEVRVADLFRLSKAMPDQADMPGVLLELNKVARDTGIEFESIVPGAALPDTGFQIVPIDLVFEGDFYDLADFLYRTRTLVVVQDGALHARGRLFNVEKIEFGEGEDHFPSIRASLRLEAYVYGTGVPATGMPITPPATDGTTPPGATPPGTTPPGTTPPGTTPGTTPNEPPAAPEGATAMGAP